MRLCKDCLHFRKSRLNSDFDECVRNRGFKIDPVHGREHEVGVKRCSRERDEHGIDNCGPMGRFWESRANRDALLQQNRKRRWLKLFGWYR